MRQLLKIVEQVRGSYLHLITNVTVPLRDEFNRNKETETSKNEPVAKTNGRSMNYRNTDNGVISTLVKLSFLLVMRD